MKANLLCPKCQTEGQGNFCSNCGTAYQIDRSEFYTLLQSKFKDRAFVDINIKDQIALDPRLMNVAERFGENFKQYQGVYGRCSNYFVMSITKLIFFIKADGYSYDQLHELVDNISHEFDQLGNELGFNDNHNLRIAFYFVFEQPVDDELFEQIYRLNNNARNPFRKKSKRRFRTLDKKRPYVFFTSFGIDMDKLRVSGYSIDVSKDEIRELITQVTGKEADENRGQHWHDKLFNKVMDQLPNKSFVQEQLKMIFSPTLLAFLIKKDRITTLKFVTFFGAFATVSQVLNDWVPERAQSLAKVLSLTEYDILNVLITFIPMFVLSLMIHGAFKFIKGQGDFKESMTATFMSSVIFIVLIQLITIIYENDSRTVGTSVIQTAMTTALVFSLFYLGSLFRRIHLVSMTKSVVITTVFFALASVVGSFINLDSFEDEIDTVEKVFDQIGADELLEKSEDQ
ncbi:MAG: Yip1 family protein [Cytophagales bacterium]|nr:Yip1 family protein [Cytophagales bacterium]